MPELSAIIVASDPEQRAMLQVLVDGTSVAHATYSSGNLSLIATDPVVRRIQNEGGGVVLVDLPPESPYPALTAIELLHQEFPDLAVFAIGSLSQPQTIVNAMRAGAKEFLQRPLTTNELLEAFVRLTAAKRRTQKDEARGKMFVVMNAKGGCGSTTVGVNLALALQAAHGNTALVDIAPLGHCSLHLNLKPLFTVADAIRNERRLDSSLLEGFMTRHGGGLQVLAGSNTPAGTEPSTAEYAKLFDLLVGHYRYIVVDLSTRMDGTARLAGNLAHTVLLVAHTDVASLWSAARVQQFLSETGRRDKIQLVLNRFRKIVGFSEGDAEAAVGVKLLWKIPNQYFAVSTAIDRGIPLLQHTNTEIARSFAALAARLTENDLDVKRKTWSLFKTVS